MSKTITVHQLFDLFAEPLKLSWLAGQEGRASMLRGLACGKFSPCLMGHLNIIRPTQIQIVGKEESSYLYELSQENQHRILRCLFSPPTVIVIISDNQEISPLLEEYANQMALPLLSSRHSSYYLISELQNQLHPLLAEKVILHGVFMEVMVMKPVGVLITGESGTGKSELALELLSRGHRFIADDIVELTRISHDRIQGTPPEALRDFMEVRGLGILNIRAMFGDAAVRPSKNLHLIVHLEPLETWKSREIQRIERSERVHRILDIDIIEIILPIAPGRNLAVLLEVAVRDFILKMDGYDANQVFVMHHNQRCSSLSA